MNRFLQLCLLVASHSLACYFYETMNFYPFWGCLIVACALSFHIIQNNQFGSPTYFIIAISLSIACFWMTPDDDINRYLWEGAVINEGHNPYRLAPDHSDLSDLSEIMKDYPVNHPEWTSIYGPLFLYILMALQFFGGGILSIKFLWFTLHLFNTWLIQRYSKYQHAWKYYCISPFILLETLGLGHMEQLLIAGVLLLVIGIQHSKRSFYRLGGLLSLWIKWWLIPLIPFIFKIQQLKSFFFLLFCSVLCVFPFIDSELTMFSSLFAFSDLWSHGYLYRGIEFIFEDHSKLLITSVLAIRAIQLYFLGGRISNQFLDLMRLGIWLSPTIHPWYATLPLALCLYEGRHATFILCGALFAGMHDAEFNLYHSGEWKTSWIHGLPAFLSFMCSERWIRRFIFFQNGPWVNQFSIVTPTLNEENNIKELGTLLKNHQSDIKEWIIVDGGSSDQTLEIAKQMRAQCLQASDKGRGHQIKQGLDTATEEWVIILHSDTRLTPNFFNDLRKSIYKHPGIVGGAFQMAYRDHKHLGPLQFLNAFKTYYFGISFGDQTQFVNTKALHKQGGFPDIPLMEDVELSLIWQGQTTAFIKSSKSLTSPRRWKEKGRIKNALGIIHLLFQYFWRKQVFGVVDTMKLYKQYYK